MLPGQVLLGMYHCCRLNVCEGFTHNQLCAFNNFRTRVLSIQNTLLSPNLFAEFCNFNIAGYCASGHIRSHHDAMALTRPLLESSLTILHLQTRSTAILTKNSTNHPKHSSSQCRCQQGNRHNYCHSSLAHGALAPRCQLLLSTASIKPHP